MIPLTVLFLLALSSFVLVILSMMGKLPLWIPVLLMTIFMMLQTIPLGMGKP